MRRFSLALITAILGAAFTQIAFAADLRVKAPVAQPAAPPQASGYIEAYSGAAWSEDQVDSPFPPGPQSDIKYNGWALGGAGRGNWWATPNLNLQLDAQAEGTDYSIPNSQLVPGSSGNFSTLSYLAGGHFDWRDQKVGLLGVFGGLGDAGGNISTGNFNNTGIRHGLLGAEGQLYYNLFTLYAQGGYDTTLHTGNVAFFNNIHAGFVRGTGRYFIVPNFLVEGTGQYESGRAAHSNTFAADTSFKTWLWRAKAEWRPGSLPFSVFAAYQGSRTDYDTNAFGSFGERIIDNRVVAGLRLYMGQDTLLANDRAGATLDIIDPLGTPTSPAMLFPTGQEVFVSDARLKRDIELVGHLDNGLGLYRYRYVWSNTIYIGVMAQEVALIRPDAVVHGLDGYLRVDYARLGLKLMTDAEWNALSTKAGSASGTPVRSPI